MIRRRLCAGRMARITSAQMNGEAKAICIKALTPSYPQFDFKREFILSKASYLIGSTPNWRPLRAVLPAKNLRQGVASTNTVQESECIADVALAAGVGAHDEGEGAEVKRLIGEVLEVNEAERGNHDYSLLPRDGFPLTRKSNLVFSGL